MIVIGRRFTHCVQADRKDFANAAGVQSAAIQTVIVLESMMTGFVVLALAQIPLSLGNSVLATRQARKICFPRRTSAVRKLSLTYAAMNLVNPFFGGVPTCHGSGGMVGHYTFGARTGGSIIIYGYHLRYIGLFFANGFQQVVQVFPLPMLGVLLMFEGAALMMFARTEASSKRDFFVVISTGIIANGLPFGYASALVIGCALYYLGKSVYREPA